MLARRDDPMSFSRLRERQDAMDDGAEPSRGDGAPEGLLESLDDRLLLRRRSRPERRADDLLSLDHQGREVEGSTSAPSQADHDEASADREGLQVALEIGAADRIEDDVHAAAARQVEDALREIIALVVDRRLCPELETAPALLLAPGGDDRPAAGLA